jgi:hypothetical protein
MPMSEAGGLSAIYRAETVQFHEIYTVLFERCKLCP